MHRKHLRATVTGTDVDIPIGTFAAGQFVRFVGGVLTTGVAGDVFGPGASTDLAIARWDGASGQLLQNSLVLISDTAQVTGVTALNGRDIARWTDGPSVGGATDNALARWDTTTGRLLQNSTVVIDDVGNITGVGTINGEDVGDFVRGPTPAASGQFNIAIWTDLGGRDIMDGLLHINNVVRTFVAEVTTGHLPEYADSTGRVLADSGLVAGHVVQSPGVSADNRVARYDGTTGKQIQTSPVVIDDGGNITGATINGFDPNNWVRGPASATDTHIAAFNGATGKVIYNSGVAVTTVVVGPASATDNAVARFNATTGKLIKNSAVIIDDSGNITGVGTLNTRSVSQFVTSATSSVADFEIVLWQGTTGRSITGSGIQWNQVAFLGSFFANDNRLVRTDTVTNNRAVQQSGITIDDSNNVSGMGTLNTRTIANWVDGPASATAGRVAVFSDTTGKLIQNGTKVEAELVQGPGGATDNRIARFDGATGYLIQNSAVTIDDSGNITGVGTLNGATIANWVVGPASATDNRIARFDSTTGKLIQNSGVTIDDSANVTGVQALSVVSINTVVPENHRARHLGGGADSVIDGSAWATGDLLAYNGSGTQFTRVTQASLAPTDGLYGNVVGAGGASVTSGTIVNFGGTGAIPVAGLYAVTCEMPYGLTDTSGNLTVSANWSSATVDAVGFSVGGLSGIFTASGGSVNIAKTSLPSAGIIRFICQANVSAGGLVGFGLARSGGNITIYNGFTQYIVI